MSVIGQNLPRVNNLQAPEGLRWDAPSEALGNWAEAFFAESEDDPTVIDILDIIDDEFWGGISDRTVGRALDAANGQDVTVRVNSPGGNAFMGVAIYNLLAAYDARVNVQILGMAASAASIIAMAGDEIAMGTGSMLMIHNAWGLAIGNRHDLRSVADIFEAIDSGLTDVYEARTGQSREDIVSWMDAETFMSAEQSIERGFATSRMDVSSGEKSAANKSKNPILARRRIEAALAKQGVPRSDRETLISQVAGEPWRDASSPTPAERDAGENQLATFLTGVAKAIT